MKNIASYKPPCDQGWRVWNLIWMIMRLTTVLIIISTLTTSAKGYSQKVSLSLENAPIKSVFNQIRQQTGCSFLWNEQTLNDLPPVTVSVHDASLADAVKASLKGLPLTYEIHGKVVYIERAIVPSSKVNPHVRAPVLPLHEISGSVVDSATGQPLVGVTIKVKGTIMGATTDINGKFNLEVEDDALLIVSSVGYTSKTILVGGKTSFEISLSATATGLNQLVVVGYGTQKKKDLTGAVVHVDATKYSQLANVSIMQSLHGAVAGLNVGAVDQPGENPAISIRGQNTLSSSASANAPLIVVDGIIYRGSIIDLNPADIESVDILKDASASAIYGSQASNGVILITTKKGMQTGSGKPVINYSVKYSLQVPSNKLKPFNTKEEGKFLKDVLWEQSRLPPDYLKPNPDFDVTSYLKTLADVEGYKNGLDNDWWDMLTGNGHIEEQDLSIGGRSNGFNYFVSGGLTDQTGFVINDDYKRYNIRVNLNTKINDWLSVGLESFLTLSNYSGEGPSVVQAFHLEPFNPVFDTSGKYTLDPDGGLNPFLRIQIKDKDIRMNLFGNFHSDLKLPFLPGFNYRINYSHNYRVSHHDSFNPWGANYEGSGYKNSNMNYDWSLDNIITYKRTFNNVHKVNLTLVYGVEEQKASSTDASAQDFQSTILGYNSLQSGDPTLNSISTGATKQSSLYSMGRLSYSFKDRYLLTGTIRRDGYSGFGTNDKIGVFPSLALGWIVSKEGFFKRNIGNWINYFKLRASYGTTARRAISAYQTLAKVSISPARIFGDGGPTSLGQSIYSLANNDLHWETTTGLNLGFDFGIIQSRVHGDFEYYHNFTRNILYDIQLPYLTGFASIPTNIGKVENHGFEFTVTGQVIKSKKFYWDASVNFSSYRNKIVSILGQDNNGDGKEDDIVSDQLFIGKPESVVYDYKIIGMWQLADEKAGNIPNGFYPGTYKIEDTNGDGKYGADDKQILGYQDPSYQIGISNTVSYKNISLYFFIHSIQGGKHYYLGDESPYVDGDERKQDQLTYSNVSGWDYWMPENPDAKYRRLDISSDYPTRPYDQRNFVRLQNVSLSYTFSNGLLSKYKIQNLKVFVSGSNLLTITKWDGWDPETGVGIVAGVPVMRSYTLGLNIKF